MDEYIQVSKEKYGYNAEQALGMLFWHKHDLDRAIQLSKKNKQRLDETS